MSLVIEHRFITEEMVQEMKPGSVIVDLAVEQMGNCALTESGKVITRNGVTIVGFQNISKHLPIQASHLYAECIWEFQNIFHQIKLTKKDPLVLSCMITHDGQTVHPLIKTKTGCNN